MNLDSVGELLVKHYEGKGPHHINDRWYPYDDRTGVLTIGDGHAILASESKKYLGGMSLLDALHMYHNDRAKFLSIATGLTDAECDELFRSDMQPRVNDLNSFYVNQCKRTPPQQEFNSMFSLIFNNGHAPLEGTVGRYLKKGDILMASMHVQDWCYATIHTEHGVKRGPIEGLSFRRYTETLLMLTGELTFAHTWEAAEHLIDLIQRYCSEHHHFAWSQVHKRAAHVG
jgi:GH24 family phage-related lysozyme (muramidase)